MLAPVVAQEVGRRLRDLALVGAVPALLLGGPRDQVLLLHDAAHGPLADRLAVLHVGVDPRVYAPVAVGAAAGLERLDHGLAGGRVLLGLAPGLGAPRVLVAALGHAHHGQDLAEFPPGPKRRHHRRLLRVGQQPRFGARVFFYYLEGRLPHFELQLHLPELHLRLSQHVLQHLDVVGQVVVFLAHGDAFLLGVPAIIPHNLPAPNVGRRPRHAVPFRDLRGWPRSRLQLGHDLHLLLHGNGVPLRVRAPVLALPRGDLVYPVAEHLAALGVAKRPHRPCQALAVLEVVLDGAPPHPCGVSRVGGELAYRHLAGIPVLVPPVAQARPRRIPQLCDGVGVAMVELDEGLYRDLSLLSAVHAASFLFRFGPGFPPQSQW